MWMIRSLVLFLSTNQAFPYAAASSFDSPVLISLHGVLCGFFLFSCFLSLETHTTLFKRKTTGIKQERANQPISRFIPSLKLGDYNKQTVKRQK